MTTYRLRDCERNTFVHNAALDDNLVAAKLIAHYYSKEHLDTDVTLEQWEEGRMEFAWLYRNGVSNTVEGVIADDITPLNDPYF